MGLALNAAALALVVLVAFLVTRWMIDRSDASDDLWMLAPDVCIECEGVGALVGPGLLRPCPRCDGTGTG